MRVEKKIIKNEWDTRIKDSKAMILTEYAGLSAEELTKLRSDLRNAKSEYKVVKNSIFKISANEHDISFFDDHLKGSIGVAFVKDDEDIVAVAKALSDYAKDNEKLSVKVGSLNGKAISDADIKALASLPSHEVLVGQLVCTLNGVIGNFVNVLRNNVKSVVTVIDAIKEQKENN